MNTPRASYQQALRSHPDFQPDEAQERAIAHFQRLFDELVQTRQTNPSLLARLRSVFSTQTPAPVRGVYLWGGVGRGKTFLMDLFFETLPFERKLRMHFHRFMQWVHHELNHLRGRPNPLEFVAEKLAVRARVLCFDEFFVSDIGDAMILAGLLEQMLRNDVTLVATSNVVPDELYRNGLQRQRFLPAIDLLKQYTEVVNLDGQLDYRLRTLESAELYHFPLDDAANDTLASSFRRLAPGPGLEAEILEIAGRPIATVRCADDVAWFDFEALCAGPRSQADYIELGRQFHAVLVGGIPVLSDDQIDAVRRFIHLVDEFYDRRVKLVLTADAPIHQLYQGRRLAFEFGRTRSRLTEMQSHEYLAREHRP